MSSHRGLDSIMIGAAIVAVWGLGVAINGLMGELRSADEKSWSSRVAQVKTTDSVEEPDTVVVGHCASELLDLDGPFASEDEEVKTVVLQIKDAILGCSKDISIEETVDESMPIWKIPGTEIFSNLEKSYGFNVSFTKPDNCDDYASCSTRGLSAELLKRSGYVFANETFYRESYYNEERQIVCDIERQYSDGENTHWLTSCAKTSWISEEQKKLAVELAGVADVNYLDFSSAKIEDSSVAPYQRFIVGSVGVRLFFYRVNPEAEWQYVETGHETPCSNFNDDAEKAFAGFGCFDEKTNGARTLNED